MSEMQWIAFGGLAASAFVLLYTGLPHVYRLPIVHKALPYPKFEVRLSDRGGTIALNAVLAVVFLSISRAAVLDYKILGIIKASLLLGFIFLAITGVLFVCRVMWVPKDPNATRDERTSEVDLFSNFMGMFGENKEVYLNCESKVLLGVAVIAWALLGISEWA